MENRHPDIVQMIHAKAFEFQRDTGKAPTVMFLNNEAFNAIYTLQEFRDIRTIKPTHHDMYIRLDKDFEAVVVGYKTYIASKMKEFVMFSY